MGIVMGIILVGITWELHVNCIGNYIGNYLGIIILGIILGIMWNYLEIVWEFYWDLFGSCMGIIWELCETCCFDMAFMSHLGVAMIPWNMI